MPGAAGAGTTGRDRAGNIVAVDLAVGQSVPVFVRAAIGIGGSLAAGRATQFQPVALKLTVINTSALSKVIFLFH